jgi:hypothetical protein
VRESEKGRGGKGENEMGRRHKTDKRMKGIQINLTIVSTVMTFSNTVLFSVVTEI